MMLPEMFKSDGWQKIVASAAQIIKKVLQVGKAEISYRECVSAEKLDFLEKQDDLNEEQKNAKKREAQDYVFPDRKRAFISFSEKCTTLAADCKELVQNLESLNSNTSVDPKFPEEPETTARASSELGIIEETIQSRISAFERERQI